jgi:hypothetical protein
MLNTQVGYLFSIHNISELEPATKLLPCIARVVELIVGSTLKC